MGRPRILIVEDSYSQALRMQLLLQREGYDVVIATDGDEGWQQACDQIPDLIVLDVNLPILDGFQVLTRLKCGRTTAHIPVIMFARSNYIGTIERAMMLGASDYLCKEDAADRDQSAWHLSNRIRDFLPTNGTTPTHEADESCIRFPESGESLRLRSG